MRCALEQQGRRLALKFADSLRHSRLRDVTHRGGTHDRPLLGHREKNPKMTQIPGDHGRAALPAGKVGRSDKKLRYSVILWAWPFSNCHRAPRRCEVVMAKCKSSLSCRTPRRHSSSAPMRPISSGAAAARSRCMPKGLRRHGRLPLLRRARRIRQALEAAGHDAGQGEGGAQGRVREGRKGARRPRSHQLRSRRLSAAA